MTNPAWQVLFSRITALVTDAGGFTAAPGRARPRVRDPGGRRHVRRDGTGSAPATGSASTAAQAWSRSSSVRRDGAPRGAGRGARRAVLD